MAMWESIEEYFLRHPSRSRVAKKMVQLGLCTRGERIYCGDVEVCDTAVARAVRVDRRVVRNTIKMINREPKLSEFFSLLTPTPNWARAATKLGWHTLQVVPEDPTIPGTLAGVTHILAHVGINIRWIIAEDPEDVENPKIFIVTDARIPKHVLNKIKRVSGVKRARTR
ncbi:MAG: regulator [Methanobacteriota archaeon]|nr:MAG: regulator [Euryarchaeota archaeon]